jgi:peptidyl-prolyl cis-trans isomerase D
MLSKFRVLAKSPIFIGLAGILVASFMLWSIRDVFRFTVSGDTVVQAGSRKIDSARFRQIFNDELKSYGQQSGQVISVQDALKNNLDRQVADALGSDESFAEYLRRTGLHPSDKLVVDQIRKAPRFFNAVSGVFDRNGYEQFIQGLGMSDAQFENLLRDELAQSQFVSGVAAGMHSPRIYDALVSASQNEGRTFAYFVLPITAVPAATTPTDAQLNGFIKEHAAQLKSPELRVLTIVGFNAANKPDASPVNEAEVQKRFAFEKDSLSTAEKRSVIEIPVKDAKTAADVSARLKGGADPLVVAKSLNVEPIVYADAPKTAIADRKAADAAFAMKAGEASGPVQGDLGLSVLKVSTVSPGHVATLDENRARIEAEVRKSTTQAKADQQIKKYEDLRSGGTSMMDAAKQVGLTPATLPPMTADGKTIQGQQAGLPPKLLKAASTLAAGADTDVVDLGQGQYAVAQVTKILPPAVPALDELRPMLTRYWMAHDIETRLQAKAAALSDEIRKGKSIEAVAAEASLPVSHGVGIVRGTAGQTFSQQLLGQIFFAKPGDVVVGGDVKPGPVVVAKLQAVVPASGAADAQQAANQAPAMTRSLLQDMGQVARTASRELVKPKIDLKRARAAVGGGDMAPAQ